MRSGLCLILVLLLAPLAAHAQTDVATTSGTVHGAVSGSVIQWLGVPYAEPPTGSARWRDRSRSRRARR
jgi:para-nitrobenzyl esterase